MLRDTEYARELAHADLGGKRIERIFIKRTMRQAIRLSAWRGNVMKTAPLVVSEDELLILMADAIAARVFSSGFTRELNHTLGFQMAGKKQKTVDEMSDTERLRYWQSLIADDPVFNGYQVVAEGTNDEATKQKLGVSLVKKPKP